MLSLTFSVVWVAKAIPHKERTTKRTKKGYNKEVKKQFKEQNE